MVPRVMEGVWDKLTELHSANGLPGWEVAVGIEALWGVAFFGICGFVMMGIMTVMPISEK
jgi:hypothetical protein